MRCELFAGILCCAFVGLELTASAQFTRERLMEDSKRITARIDRGVQQAKTDAQELIKERQYVQAVTRLQSILDHPEDFFRLEDFKRKDDAPAGVKAQTPTDSGRTRSGWSCRLRTALRHNGPGGLK